jgi:hypothetical protein
MDENILINDCLRHNEKLKGGSSPNKKLIHQRKKKKNLKPI